jgi:hypothetical protein
VTRTRTAQRLRRLLPASLGSLAGVACAACCAIPLLLAAGVLGGTGWAAAARFMPGVAAGLAALAGLTWWWAWRRHTHPAGCVGGTCSCSAYDAVADLDRTLAGDGRRDVGDVAGGGQRVPVEGAAIASLPSAPENSASACGASVRS